ncbi:hypothetical protein Syun_028410 [Stephania yunnanensis]|uniref:Uncharacterized protein n=1 Tax=Stephania yunnanensis TaxID=152371 RepID=A0AAP0EHQ1_9MAGN
MMAATEPDPNSTFQLVADLRDLEVRSQVPTRKLKNLLAKLLVYSKQGKGSSNLEEVIVSLIGIKTSFGLFKTLFLLLYIIMGLRFK